MLSVCFHVPAWSEGIWNLEYNSRSVASHFHFLMTDNISEAKTILYIYNSTKSAASHRLAKKNEFSSTHRSSQPLIIVCQFITPAYRGGSIAVISAQPLLLNHQYKHNKHTWEGICFNRSCRYTHTCFGVAHGCLEIFCSVSVAKVCKPTM